jgi:hypothetical protein
VARLQHDRVGVGLVGDERLEAVPRRVGEAHLVRRAGVGPLAAADRASARRPARKVQARKLSDPRAAAPVAVGVCGWPPVGLPHRKDGLADPLGEVEPDREVQAAADDLLHQGMGGARGVAPCLSEWASIRVASRSITNGSAGAAPSAHARVRALASADQTAAIPRGSAGNSQANTRQAVGTLATSPNTSGWSRRTRRSLTQSPPAASITARSRSTCPRS